MQQAISKSVSWIYSLTLSWMIGWYIGRFVTNTINRFIIIIRLRFFEAGRIFRVCEKPITYLTRIYYYIYTSYFGNQQCTTIFIATLTPHHYVKAITVSYSLYSIIIPVSPDLNLFDNWFSVFVNTQSYW